MKKTIFFDLTELIFASSGKRELYYGISRTVHEIGKVAALRNKDIVFVVYSFGTKEFYKIPWHKTANGEVIFDLPTNLGQKWVRSYFGKSHILPIVFGFLARRTHKKNKDQWLEHAANLLPTLITEGIFFSAARPKLIVDMVRSLRANDSKVEIVPMLHDFMPLHDGATKWHKGIDRNFLLDNKYLIDQSAQIVTNSQFTAKELSKFVADGVLPRPRHPVKVIPLVHQCPAGMTPPEIEIPSGQYLLTVGLNLGRKNIEVVLEALLRLAHEGKNPPKLVIAGIRREKVRRYAKRQKFSAIQNLLIFVDNPNQTDLVRLYTNAFALVMPSKLEGWGLPAGEALWCGTPPICSTAEALREVCGDLAIYFEPTNSSELADIINQMMSDSCLYRELKSKIAKARPTLRDWSAVTDELLEAFI